MSLWKKLIYGLGLGAAAQSGAQSSDMQSDMRANLLESIIAAREAAYAQHFGPLPAEILKMANLVGRWPGGGIYKIHNGDQRWIYITSGLSNPDIPRIDGETSVQHDDHGRISAIHANLQGDGATLPETGYGYEIMVIAEEDAQWPLMLLQWAISAEFEHHIDLLSRIEQYHGVTVGELALDDEKDTDILIQKAQAPLPASLKLPNGDIPLLVITTITPEELQWSLENGRQPLLERLLASDIQQTSIRERQSVTD